MADLQVRRPSDARDIAECILFDFAASRPTQDAAQTGAQPMPEFFFDVYGRHDFRDETGVELPDVESATVHAFKMFVETVQWSGALWNDVHIAVRDETGSAVLRLRAKLEIEHNPPTDPAENESRAAPRKL